MSVLDRLLEARRQKLGFQLESNEMDGLLVYSPILSAWLSGRPHSDSALFQVHSDIVWDPSTEDLLELQGKVVGLVGSPSTSQAVAMSGVSGLSLVDGTDAYSAARRSKDIFELEMLTRAATATAGAFRLTSSYLSASETRFVAELQMAFEQTGGDSWAYDPSVASGAEASYVWSPPDRHCLMKQEPFSVIDAATAVRGYKSDCTVTILRWDSPSYTAKLRTLQRVLREVTGAISEGQRECRMLAEMADEILLSEGLQKLPHALGHGIGLQLHEYPYLTRTSKHTLEPGDVFTLEPAFYEPLIGGGRLESTFAIDRTNQLVQLNDAHELSDELTAMIGDNVAF